MRKTLTVNAVNILLRLPLRLGARESQAVTPAGAPRQEGAGGDQECLGGGRRALGLFRAEFATTGKGRA